MRMINKYVVLFFKIEQFLPKKIVSEPSRWNVCAHFTVSKRCYGVTTISS